MLKFYKYSLGPVLLLQGLFLKATALRLPEAVGPRSGVFGRDVDASPIKLLFVGDSSAAGVGVEDQKHALAYQAAKFLSERTGRSVTWQLIAKSGVNTHEALELVKRSTLTAADVLITSLGTNDVTSQRTPKQFLNDYQTLVKLISQRVKVQAVITTGLPPLRMLPAAPQPLRWYLGKYAARLDAMLEAWVERQDNFSYIDLNWAAVPHAMARDRYHPGLEQYRHWASLVAERTVRLMC